VEIYTQHVVDTNEVEIVALTNDGNVVPENAPNFVPENVVSRNAPNFVLENIVPGNAETAENVVANVG